MQISQSRNHSTQNLKLTCNNWLAFWKTGTTRANFFSQLLLFILFLFFCRSLISLLPFDHLTISEESQVTIHKHLASRRSFLFFSRSLWRPSAPIFHFLFIVANKVCRCVYAKRTQTHVTNFRVYSNETFCTCAHDCKLNCTPEYEDNTTGDTEYQREGNENAVENRKGELFCK